MQYMAYDDEGIIKVGTKQECLKGIVDLIESGELDNVYDESDLIEILNYFSRKFDEEKNISFYGFSIQKIEES